MTGNSRMKAPVIGTLLATTLALSGCVSDGGGYQMPRFAFASNYSTESKAVPVLLDNAAWWEKFNDPVLEKLVDRALRDNIDLAIAVERITQAQAELGTIASPVSVTSGVEARHEKVSPAATPDNVVDANIGFSWLLDPWGGRKAQVRAARSRIEAADAEADAAKLLLLYNLCNAYVDLRYRQSELAIRQREIRGRRQTLRTTETLVDQNSATRLDLVRAQARYASAQAAVPVAEAAVRVQKNQIATLLGLAPGHLPVNLDTGGQPRARMSPDVGIPADLLRNRPDIRIAERQYYAAVADTGAARAALYPSLSLGGAITQALAGRTIGTDYYFGPTLTLPALPGDARNARVTARESLARQAHLTWKSTVIGAIEEVESGLVTYKSSAAAVGAAQRAAELYGEAVTLTRDLVNREGATIPDLLDAEALATQAELTLASNRRDLARGFVSLNVSLGAGHARTPAERTAEAQANLVYK